MLPVEWARALVLAACCRGCLLRGWVRLVVAVAVRLPFSCLLSVNLACFALAAPCYRYIYKRT